MSGSERLCSLANSATTAFVMLSVTIDTHAAGIPADQLPVLGRKVLDAMRAMPGVRSATLASSPIETGSRSTSGIDLSRVDAAAPLALNVETSRITPGYFSTLGIPLLRGRDFSQSDAVDAGHRTPSAVIVNEALCGSISGIAIR